MDLLDLLLLLIVAAVCGSIGMAISGFSRGGCLLSIVVGFIGALLGVWLARTLTLPEPLMMQFGDVRFPVVWSIVGAALFVAVISFLTPRNRPD